MKTQYYTYICPMEPDCEWRTTGNWKRQMSNDYFVHFMEDHYLKPFIHKHAKDKNKIRRQKI